MFFARITVVAVLAAVLVDGAPSELRYKPTREEMQKLLPALQEALHFGTELKKLPGFNDIDAESCFAQGNEKCFAIVMRALSTLYKKGYEPWNIHKIDPLAIADFEKALPSAKFNYKNVEVTGFDTIKMKYTEQSIEDIFSKKPADDKFTVDLTVKGKMGMSLTVGDKEHTFETDFTKTYPGVNVVVHGSCEKFSWRFQECSKNYQISHTFDGKPVVTLSDGFENDVAYQEWYGDNVNAVKKQEDELLEKYVKEFVDAFYGVFITMQQKFESSVDGDKIDYLISYMRQHPN